ncbi:hypothetical protein BS47DRAFT_1367113 [Hydnum rufescens UP504]|uniref:Uncharacterized protein n=1 Tax=Hydnum rufescens UP504 TaxID=1448309 RepID=A0A9P6AK16_9AGAM|nr:hypothetical protein BS47DRAFT_1367113 [Hydnum rufescens UP504]
MSAIKFPYPEGRYPRYEYPDDIFDLSHQFIERKGFGKVVFCLGVEDASGLMVAYIPRGVPFVFQPISNPWTNTTSPSLRSYFPSVINTSILSEVKRIRKSCQTQDEDKRAVKVIPEPHSPPLIPLNPIIIFLSFPMDPTIVQLWKNAQKAGKPGWFCPDMLAKERKFTRAFLNWMMVKSVVPESPNFKVEVRLGIAVQNAPEREACIHPLFTHNPFDACI